MRSSTLYSMGHSIDWDGAHNESFSSLSDHVEAQTRRTHTQNDWLQRQQSIRSRHQQAAQQAAQAEAERLQQEQEQARLLLEQQEKEKAQQEAELLALDDGTDIPPWHRSDTASKKPAWLLELLVKVAEKHDDDIYSRYKRPQNLPPKMEIPGIQQAAKDELQNDLKIYKTPQALPPKQEAQVVKVAALNKPKDENKPFKTPRALPPKKEAEVVRQAVTQQPQVFYVEEIIEEVIIPVKEEELIEVVEEEIMEEEIMEEEEEVEVEEIVEEEEEVEEILEEEIDEDEASVTLEENEEVTPTLALTEELQPTDVPTTRDHEILPIDSNSSQIEYQENKAIALVEIIQSQAQQQEQHQTVPINESTTAETTDVESDTTSPPGKHNNQDDNSQAVLADEPVSVMDTSASEKLTSVPNNYSQADLEDQPASGNDATEPSSPNQSQTTEPSSPNQSQTTVIPRKNMQQADSKDQPAPSTNASESSSPDKSQAPPVIPSGRLRRTKLPQPQPQQIPSTTKESSGTPDEDQPAYVVPWKKSNLRPSTRTKNTLAEPVEKPAYQVPWKEFKLNKSRIRPRDLMDSKVQEKLQNKPEILKPAFVVTQKELKSSKPQEKLNQKPQLKKPALPVTKDQLKTSKVQKKIDKKPPMRKASFSISKKELQANTVQEKLAQKSELKKPAVSVTKDQLKASTVTTKLDKKLPMRKPSYTVSREELKTNVVKEKLTKKPNLKGMHAPVKIDEMVSVKRNLKHLDPFTCNGPSDLVSRANLYGPATQKPLWMQRALVLQNSYQNLAEGGDQDNSEKEVDTSPKVPWANFQLRPSNSARDLKSSDEAQKIETKPMLREPSLPVPNDEESEQTNDAKAKPSQEPKIDDCIKVTAAEKDPRTSKKKVKSEKRDSCFDVVGPSDLVSSANMDDSTHSEKPSWIERALALQQSYRELESDMDVEEND